MNTIIKIHVLALLLAASYFTGSAQKILVQSTSANNHDEYFNVASLIPMGFAMHKEHILDSIALAADSRLNKNTMTQLAEKFRTYYTPKMDGAGFVKLPTKTGNAHTVELTYFDITDGKIVYYLQVIATLEDYSKDKDTKIIDIVVNEPGQINPYDAAAVKKALEAYNMQVPPPPEGPR